MTRTRLEFAALIALTFASAASASYHFIHFNSRTAPWTPIPEKFDVRSLHDNTLLYYITDQTGVQLAPGDSYAGLISHIRGAAKVWNDVDTSNLRLAFGGFAAPNSPQSAPSLEIVFEDLPPGLIATGTPTVRAEANGEFVPILRSVVMLRPDLRTRPSFSESLFGTLIHEIGHGLGLQHTFTSGVMSTAITRTTSRSKPLAADDVAAISLLYPARSFRESTGSISGRVTMSSGGVNLASVVAISPSGAAVSTLTNPDGSYRIDGLPPRQYYVYAHPLPPPRQGQTTPGDIVFPRDSDGQPLSPSGPFLTVFYPGTNDPSRALTISSIAGQTTENVNFSVSPRNGYGMHSVDTRAFPGDAAVKPPYLSPNIPYPFIVASGSGLVSDNAPTPGLTVRVLGGATLAVKPYAPAPSSFLQIDFDVRTLSFSTDSARHLVFSANNDIYVLPAAFFHVDRPPPSITSVIAITDGTQRLALITGTQLGEASRVMFDGVSAPVRDFDPLSGRLTVVPPVAAPGHRASVVVLNPDGQSSLFLQGDTPSTYTYFGDAGGLTSATPSVTIAPGVLAPGTEAMIQIETTGGTFAEGQTTIGFGTSDITVRQISVVSPTRLLANVAVSANGQPGTAQLSVASGLQLISHPFAVQVAPSARSFWLSGKILNADTGAPGVTAGANALVTIGSAPITLTNGNLVLYLNDRVIPTLSTANGQILFQVPAGTAPGPTVLRVEAAGERSFPILMIVDSPPPRILSAITSGENSRLKQGQLVALTVDDLQTAGTVLETSEVEVQLGGVSLRVAQVTEQADTHRVLIVVPEDAPTGDHLPLTISVGTRVSEPVAVTVED